MPVSAFRESSVPTRIIVISDGDLIRNDYDPGRKQSLALGYDLNMRYQFSNKELLINAIDYLAGQDIVNVRGKEIKLRPLDKEKIIGERFTMQVINIVIPVILLILFGIVRFYIRKRKYSRF